MDVGTGFHSRAFLDAENGHQNGGVILERVLEERRNKRGMQKHPSIGRIMLIPLPPVKGVGNMFMHFAADHQLWLSGHQHTVPRSPVL